MKPCPFCGYAGEPYIVEGLSFRYLVAECGECGARAPEVRIDTLNKDRAAQVANGRAAAIKEWNTRKPE